MDCIHTRRNGKSISNNLCPGSKWELHFKRNGARFQMKAPFRRCNGSSITKRIRPLDFVPFVEIMDVDAQRLPQATATRMFQQLPRSLRSRMLPTAKVNGRLPLIPLQTRGLCQALVLRIKRSLTVRAKLDVSDHAYLVLACANYSIQVRKTPETIWR